MCRDSKDIKLQLGTEVKIIGPSRGGDSRHTGEEFEISQIDISKSHGEFYSCEGFSWYPASSLRLVEEELRIGDWVEVVGPAEYGDRSEAGLVFQINLTENNNFSGEGFSKTGYRTFYYPAKSLRKLNPDEMQPIIVIPTIEGNSKRLDAHREEIDAANTRLSAIEHRQEAQRKRLSQLEIRQDNHGKRLADVEYILSEIEKRLELIR